MAQEKATADAETAELRIIELEAALEEQRAGRREDAAAAAAAASEASAAAQAAQDALRTELMGAQTKSSELDTVAEQLSAAKAEGTRLASEVAELRNEVATLRTAVQLARSERDEARDMVEQQQAALHGSNDEAEAEKRRLETEIGALKSRLASNDDLHSKEVANLQANVTAAATKHAEATKQLQTKLADAERAAAEGEVAKLQVKQLQAKVEALVRVKLTILNSNSCFCASSARRPSHKACSLWCALCASDQDYTHRGNRARKSC